jgi:hypothetical protein
MAEYTHRYETADDLLADLRFVMESADPYAVKPAMLPSMHGRDVVDAEPEQESFEFAHVAKAGSPEPPREERNDQSPPTPSPEPAVAAAAAPAVADPQRRPMLEVTNWWTGAYRVKDAGSAAAVADPAPDQRAYAAYRHDVGQLRQQVRQGVMSTRKAAREQVKAARRRAHEMRHRARTHRHRSLAERQPSAALIVVSLLFIAIVIAAALPVGLLVMASTAKKAHHARAEAGIATIVDGLAGLTNRGRPLLLVPSVSDRDDPEIRARLEELIAKHEQDGYDVIVDHELVDGGMRDLIEQWNETHDPAVDEQLEDALEDHDLYGILHVTEQLGGGPVKERIAGKIVWSTRPGAELRRYAHAPPVLTDRPLILLNDHPTWHNPEIKQAVDRQVRKLERAGHTVVIDDEREVLVRKAMPSGPYDPDQPLPEMLARVLDDAALGGVVWVYAEPGESDPAERLAIRVITPPARVLDQDDAEATEVPLAIPAPAQPEIPDESFEGEQHSRGSAATRLAA